MTSSDASKKRSRTSRAARRVGRLLSMVPYVLEHPGTRVSELASLFGGTEEEVLADLDVLFVTGLPPYGPADLVEVEVDEGRVWISMADHFARPLRLTRGEALSLYLRGRSALEVGGAVEAPALASALAKLEHELGDETIASLAAIVEAGDGSAAGPEEQELLAQLRGALERRERLELEYYTASRDEVTTRTIEPEAIFLQLGAWYVNAWDGDAGDVRTFRVDRIKRVTPTGATYEPRETAEPALGAPNGTEQVRLRLEPEARWVSEYYDAEPIAMPDGSVEVEIGVADLAWAAKLVLRLGSSAQIVSPDELRDAVRAQAHDARAHYS